MSSPQFLVYGVARTPFGKFYGDLSGYPAAELGAIALNEVMLRSAGAAAAIDGVRVGVGMIGGAALTVARQAVLLSDLPEATPSLGFDRACCSGLSSLAIGTAELRAGMADLLICGGLESLSTTPRLLARSATIPVNTLLDDPLLLSSPFSEGSIASYTSEEALRVGIDRMAQDEWAQRSHDLYFAA